MALEVKDNESLERYEVASDGDIAFLSYRRKPDAITLVHTEVPERLGGKGIGSLLARHALEAGKAKGDTVIVRCPFLIQFLEKHPEFQSPLLQVAK